MGKTVKLISREGDEFQIPISSCRLSEVITCELECYSSGDEGESGTEDNDNSSCIMIPLIARRIRSKTLQKVTDFMEHYDEEEMTPISPPFTTENIEEIVQKWYADFISIGVDHPLLIDIISASDFLSIQPLLSLSSLALSLSINGESPETIRSIFHMTNNLDNEEQRRRVMKENDWALEATSQFESDGAID